jgi:hypothetical protein
MLGGRQIWKLWSREKSLGPAGNRTSAVQQIKREKEEENEED